MTRKTNAADYIMARSEHLGGITPHPDQVRGKL
jgi:hypothetical protein